MNRMIGSRFAARVTAGLLTFVLAASTLLTGNLTGVLAAPKNDNTASAYDRTEGISFVYTPADEVDDSVSADYVNQVKFTIDLVDRNGNSLSAKDTVKALNQLNVSVSDVTVDADLVQIDASTFSDIAIEGYTFDEAYAFFYWNGTYQGTKRAVTSLKNFGTLSKNYPNYISYIGFTTAEDKGSDYAGDKNGYYAYNPTGTLRVVFKQVTQSNPYKTVYVNGTETVAYYTDTVAWQKNKYVYTPVEYSEDADPEREGYRFIGWSTKQGEDGYGDPNALVGNTFYSTTVTSDKYLYAAYEKNTFSVTFNDEDGTILYTTTVDFGTVISDDLYAGETSVQELADAKDTTDKNYTFAGWAWDTNAAVVREDVVATATYTTKNVYTVTFKNGEDVVATYYVEEGDKLTTTPSVSQTVDCGIFYRFDYWTRDGKKIGVGAIKKLAITEDITFEAVLYRAVTIGFYTLNVPKDTLKDFRDQVSINTYDSDDYSTLLKKTIIRDDVSDELVAALKAAYTLMNDKSNRYGTNDTEKINAILAEIQSLVDQIDPEVFPDVWYVVKAESYDAKLAGYKEWHFDGGFYTDYTVVFNYKDAEGEDTSSTQIKNYGNDVAEPEVISYEDDTAIYTFDHWTTEVDGETVIVEAIPAVTGDATYTAVYAVETKQYTVTYTVDDIVLTTLTVDAGTEVATLLAKEYTAAEGFTFNGWETEEESEIVIRDIVITGTTELIPSENEEETEAEEIIEDEDETEAEEVTEDEEVAETEGEVLDDEEDLIEETENEGEVEADEDVVEDVENETDEDVTDGADQKGEVEADEDVVEVIDNEGEVEADEDIATGETGYVWYITLMGAAVAAIAAALAKKKLDASEE